MPLPLTQGQLLIWTGQRLHPDTPLYNMAFTFALGGPVDPDRFRRAFERLVADSDALRTVVDDRDATALRQRVVDPVDLSPTIEFVDLSGAPDPVAASRAFEQARAARNLNLGQRSFDSVLLRLADDQFRWFFLQHHIVTDAWSFGVMFRHMAAHYTALDEPAEAPRPGPLPLYATHVAQATNEANRRDTGPVTVTTGVEAPAALYGQRPARGTTRSVRVPLALGAERAEALRALTRTPEVMALTIDLALFNLFATVLFAYLHRVSGARRLVLGAPFHNRTTAQARATVGLFTEVLPLAVEVEASDTFSTLHGKVREASQTYLRHATTSAADRRPHRGISAVLNVIRGSFGDFADVPVAIEWIHPGHHDREHPLRLHVHDFAGTGALDLLLDFNADTFDADRRGAALGHLERLLDGLLADWHAPIASVALLSSAERRALLVDFNRDVEIRDVEIRGVERAVDAPTTTVLEQLHAQVRATPRATALIHGRRRWSYQELVARVAFLAAQIDAALQDLNEGSKATARPRVVALALPRSGAAVVAMLATWQAGATLVPLDPQDPVARQAHFCAQAGVVLVLTAATAGSERPPSLALPTLTVSPDTGTVSPRHESANGHRPSPRGHHARLDAPAYVLFTSGSTGRPKGVTMGHRALAHYVAWAASHYGAGRTFGLFSPLTFDLTMTSVFVPLVSGGTVVVYPPSGEGADLALLDVVADRDHPVDILKLTPSHLDLLAPAEETRSPLAQLIFGGEALTRAHVRRARAIFGKDVTIHNEYGPTEATVGCMVETVAPDDESGAAIAIGRPIARMQAYVLDAHLAPVPVGVVGDLYVAGTGLAQGYAGDPGQTAERFVPNPLAAHDEGGDRLYRTGDRARFTSNETVAYVGRTDDQVKVRGARVELGEVETAFAQHPDVMTCVAHVATVEAEAQAALEAQPASIRSCRRCGLASNHPDADLDDTVLCKPCRSFDRYRDDVAEYFKTPDDLRAILDAAPPSPEGGYHCLALLSGGKDSTFVLCQLVDMGYRVLAYTLDNGFLSEQAKANITRVAETLGVDHIFGSTPAMNRIFVDSLERHANVCQGCFKTIYTLSMTLAQDQGIPYIVTGLSRGQFFETRLTEDLFTNPTLDLERIDDTVLEARKAYHQVDDAVRRLLDTTPFDDDRIFEQVQFLDFYRYWPVDLDDMYAYLDARVPWVRPTDTGRSTNCLINDVGIFVHRTTRGFHNYALPYSWDVRMGHKTRDAALAELDDEIDPAAVERLLDEIDYPHDVLSVRETRRLVLYYTAAAPISIGALRRHAHGTLPSFMVPSSFVHLDTLPTTRHGKVDRAALPAPGTSRAAPVAAFMAPRTATETTLATVWADVLRRDRVGVHDNFFELGGDSIMAIQIVARCHRHGLALVPAQLFEALTIAALAHVVGTTQPAAAVRGTGPVPLLPAQQWFFDHVLAHGPEEHRWHHQLTLDSAMSLDPDVLRASLATVTRQHDALRLAFHHHDGAWRAALNADDEPPPLTVVEDHASAARPPAPRTNEADQLRHLDQPPLLRASLVRSAEGHERLVLTAHHLIVDAVSWSILVDDLCLAYGRHARNTAPALPPATGTGAWAQALEDAAQGMGERERDHWQTVVAHAVNPIPTDRQPAERTPPAERAQRTERAPFAAQADRADRVVTALDAATTEALFAVPQSGRLRLHEVLIAALAWTLSTWTGSRTVRMFIEGHGRDALPASVSGGATLDASRTVGWLTSLYPALLTVPDEATAHGADRTKSETAPAAWLDATMRSVKDQLRAIPRHGAGYAPLRSDVLPDQPDLLAFEREHLVFNYMGHAHQLVPEDSPWSLAEPLQLLRPTRGRQPFRLEVDAMIVDHRLQVTWTYRQDRHQPATITRYAERFVQHVRALVTRASEAESSTVSASDFPLANLDANKLGKLAAALAPKKTR